MGKKSWNQILADAKLPERTVELVMGADVLADIEVKERELTKIMDADAGDQRMGDSDRSEALRDEIRALEAEAAESTITVTLRAFKRAAWRKIVADTTTDEMSVEAGLTAIMEIAVPRSIVEPVMGADEKEQLLDVITDGQYQQLYNVVWELNRGSVNVPKSLRASMVPQKNSEKREQDEN